VTLDAFIRHAERFGVEEVLEAAAGAYGGKPELPVAELVTLARRLRELDPKFDPAKLFPDLGTDRLRAILAERDALHERMTFDERERTQRNVDRRNHLDELLRASVRRARLKPVLDVLATPEPTPAGRGCEWCGQAIGGRADRRTCSPKCRRALQRAGGAGPFSRPEGTPTSEPDLGIVPSRSVTPTPHSRAKNPAPKRGVSTSHEVSAQESLFEEARAE
jgi:hypothetical protein